MLTLRNTPTVSKVASNCELTHSQTHANHDKLRGTTEAGGIMNKFGPKAQKEVRKAVREMKQGTLRSGSDGKKVTSKKQAVAIGLSKARKAGGKVPKKETKQ